MFTPFNKPLYLNIYNFSKDKKYKFLLIADKPQKRRFPWFNRTSYLIKYFQIEPEYQHNDRCQYSLIIDHDKNIAKFGTKHFDDYSPDIYPYTPYDAYVLAILLHRILHHLVFWVKSKHPKVTIDPEFWWMEDSCANLRAIKNMLYDTISDLSWKRNFCMQSSNSNRVDSLIMEEDVDLVALKGRYKDLLSQFLFYGNAKKMYKQM